MKVWQDTSWEKRIGKLQGNSLRVLWHLVHIATWENQVTGPSETAISMGLKQPNISRAYAELRKADLLYQAGGSYRLNPYFCWKGGNEQYEIACKQLFSIGAQAKELALK